MNVRALRSRGFTTEFGSARTATGARAVPTSGGGQAHQWAEYCHSEVAGRREPRAGQVETWRAGAPLVA